MATMAGQRTKLKFDLSTFRRNIERLQSEAEWEVPRILKAGASAYITSSVKHTPPSIGEKEIDPRFYADGVMHYAVGKSSLHGRRRVVDLLQAARDPASGHWRSVYGKLLRAGYKYLVYIKRPGKQLKVVPCRSEAGAVRAAHEAYRGLMRAAWGLAAPQAFGTGKYPPAVQKLVDKRPDLARMAHLNEITVTPQMIEITNHVIPSGAPFAASTDVNASISAARTMNNMIGRFYAKRSQV